VSAPNTKSSKIDRLLTRQTSANTILGSIYAEVRDGRETDKATIKMLSAAVASLEDDNRRLRKYLGSVLFHRRQLMVSDADQATPSLREPPFKAIPTLRIADTAITARPHPNAAEHIYDRAGRRCIRCYYLKAAIDATGVGCVEAGAAAGM
jgi:hypothetical protein